MQDGLAILTSTLQFFLNKKKECPKLLCSTHYTEMFQFKLLDFTNIQFWTMDVLLDKPDCAEIPTKENEVVYLYK